jgi:hypothetical protein
MADTGAVGVVLEEFDVSLIQFLQGIVGSAMMSGVESNCHLLPSSSTCTINRKGCIRVPIS